VHKSSKFLPQKCMAKMVFFQLVEFLLGDPNCKLETSPVPQRSAVAPPFLRPSSPILPPFGRTPNTQTPLFRCRQMQLICFYASGGGLKDPNPTHPLIKKASTHPRFGATVPPPPQTPPLKNAHCILSRKNTRRQAAPLWKPPFLPLAIVFVASWPSFELRQLQRLQRGRGVGRGGGYVLNELQSLCSACVSFSFSVIVYCILYIFPFCTNKTKKKHQIGTRKSSKSTTDDAKIKYNIYSDFLQAYCNWNSRRGLVSY